MKKREVNLNRGPYVGPLETTTGITYLRPQDISAVTEGEGVTMIHMTSGTIFTVKDTLMKTIEMLGVDMQIGVVAGSEVKINDPIEEAEHEDTGDIDDALRERNVYSRSFT